MKSSLVNLCVQVVSGSPSIINILKWPYNGQRSTVTRVRHNQYIFILKITSVLIGISVYIYPFKNPTTFHCRDMGDYLK